jgi:3-oxoacyl-[acyl-carrier protein] reductase
MTARTLAAVVTGASSGIGREIAVRLARDGFVVHGVARRADRLDTLAGEVAAAGGRFTPVPADLSERAGQHAAIEAVRAAGVDVGVVVNNAGGSVPVPADDPEPAWASAMALQFEAVRRLTDAFADGMRERGWGRIITIGAPLEPPPRMNASTVAKGAVTIWSKIRASELAPHGITVNTVAPGRILTEQVVERLHPSAEEREAFARDNIPAGVLGHPTDVAALVSFLTSDEAGYLTGELIHVDGGLRRSAW